ALVILKRTRSLGATGGYQYRYKMRLLSGWIPWRAVLRNQGTSGLYSFCPGLPAYQPGRTEIAHLPQYKEEFVNIVAGYGGVTQYCKQSNDLADALLPEPYATAVELDAGAADRGNRFGRAGEFARR